MTHRILSLPPALLRNSILLLMYNTCPVVQKKGRRWDLGQKMSIHTMGERTAG